jgi:hypothetical protein
MLEAAGSVGVPEPYARFCIWAMEKVPYPKFVNKAKKEDRSREIRPGPLSLGEKFAVRTERHAVLLDAAYLGNPLPRRPSRPLHLSTERSLS